MLFSAAPVPAQTSDDNKPPQVGLQSDGTIDIPAESVPMSKFLSPEGKNYLNQHLHDMLDKEKVAQVNGVPRFMMPYLERQKALYALKVYKPGYDRTARRMQKRHGLRSEG